MARGPRHRRARRPRARRTCGPRASRSTSDSGSRPRSCSTRSPVRLGARHPQRHAGHRRGARRRDRPRRRRPRRHRARQRRRRGRHPAAASWSSTHRSRTCSRPRSRRWRCCSRWRATSRRRTPTSKPASGTAAGGTGVELHGKTLGIVGLGRVGVLVAQRCSGVRDAARRVRPVRERRARPSARRRARSRPRRLVATADFITIHLPKTPETIGLFDADLLAQAKPTLRIVNTARGGIIDEDALADALARPASSRAPLSTCSPRSPPPSRRCSTSTNVVVTPHLGASTVEAQDKAGQTIAEMVVLALAGEFVPFAVNLAAAEASSTVAPFLPARGAARSPLHARSPVARSTRSRSSTRVRSPTTTARCSRSRR